MANFLLSSIGMEILCLQTGSSSTLWNWATYGCSNASYNNNTHNNKWKSIVREEILISLLYLLLIFILFVLNDWQSVIHFLNKLMIVCDELRVCFVVTSAVMRFFGLNLSSFSRRSRASSGAWGYIWRSERGLEGGNVSNIVAAKGDLIASISSCSRTHQSRSVIW